MSIPMEWDDVPLVLTLEQVADLLQTGRTATYEAYRAGQIPGFRVGRKLRFARETVRQVVEGGLGSEPAAHRVVPSARLAPRAKAAGRR